MSKAFKEIEVKIPGLMVRGLEAGTPDGLPVLALHGWLDNAASFTPLCSCLPAGIRLIALDLPGHGHSDHLPIAGSYHFIDWVTVVIEVADALGLEQFSLMGHSMGAGISTLVAGTFPERIRSVVFLEGLGPMAGRVADGPEDLREHILQGQRIRAKRMGVYPDKGAAVEMLKAATGMERSSASTLVERGLKEVEGGFFWRSDPRMRQRSALRLTEEQVLQYLNRITAPSILIQATDGFPFDGGGMLKRKDTIPELVVQEIEGHHHVHMEKPEEIMKHIASYLIRG